MEADDQDWRKKIDWRNRGEIDWIEQIETCGGFIALKGEEIDTFALYLLP